MANEQQLAILRQGVETWNKWRIKNPRDYIDFSKTDLSGTTIKGIDFWKADFSGADLSNTNLSKSYLRMANLRLANLRGANLRGTDLSIADLGKADLTGADLTEANLREAFLNEANLTNATLTMANLRGASLIGTRVDGVDVSGSSVYGISVWDIKGEFNDQKDLIITPSGVPVITVDNIKVAQFIYLILNNREIRDVINTLTSKTVLILGRFSIPERKAVLDALRNKLREYDLLPVVFDFDRPTDKDFTETVKTLAGISYFVVADITNSRSSPLELQATIPDYQVPFVPIIQEGERPFAMMVDLQKKYNWVLETLEYDSIDTLINALKPAIIDPAIKKHNELRLIKAREPKIRSAKDLLER